MNVPLKVQNVDLCQLGMELLRVQGSHQAQRCRGKASGAQAWVHGAQAGLSYRILFF